MLPRLTEMFQRFPAGAVPPADGTHYAFRPGLVGGAWQFALTDQGLSWTVGGRSGEWAFGDIASVRLSYRPSSMQSRRFRADIKNVSGANLTLYSTPWQTASLMARQDDGYRVFIVELHRRLAGANSNVRLAAGLNAKLYYTALVLMSFVGVAMTGLLLRALWIGEFVGALFLIGFAALFVWQVGGFITRNRPRVYTPDALPTDVLP